MGENESLRRGIPLCVRARAYARHALIAAISLLALIFLFAFIAGKTLAAISEIRRVDSSPNNEIVFAKERNGDASFIYLKNFSVSGETNENALSDVLMTIPGAEYRGDLYFNGGLADGTCAVSANIASRYGLSVGSRAKVMGTDKTFTVAQVLTAESGIDEDYMHEGIVILAYDESLLGRAFSYVSFMTDGDGYRSLERLVFTKDLAEAAKESLFRYAFISALTVLAAVSVSELFLFGKRRRDYALLAEMGKGRAPLFVRMLSENAVKYLAPSLIAAAVFAPRYACYEEVYLISVLSLSAISLTASLILTFIFMRRVYRVRTK